MSHALLPMLQARGVLCDIFLELDSREKRKAREDAVCRGFMGVPGVGEITALSFKSTVDDPARFKSCGIGPQRRDQAEEGTTCASGRVRAGDRRRGGARRAWRGCPDGSRGDPGLGEGAVIAPPQVGPAGGVRVLMATKPVDFRKGANGLAALIKEEMKADPFSGMVYVFRAYTASEKG